MLTPAEQWFHEGSVARAHLELLEARRSYGASFAELISILLISILWYQYIKKKVDGWWILINNY